MAWAPLPTDAQLDNGVQAVPAAPAVTQDSPSSQQSAPTPTESVSSGFVPLPDNATLDNQPSAPTSVRQITHANGKALDQPITVPVDATDDQIRQIVRQHGINVSNDTAIQNLQGAPVQQQGAGEEFLGNLKNDIAGIIQGAASLPDVAAKGAGQVMSIIPNAISHALSAAGHTDAAQWIQDHITHNLANPVQIGNAVEQISPTPNTTEGHIDRFVGNLVGGAAAMPESLTNRIVTSIIGDVPKAGPVSVPQAAETAAKAPPSASNQDFSSAANRQGVSYMAADLPNAPKSKFATALSNLTFGAIPLAQQGAKNIASASEAAARAATDVGAVSDATGAGQAAQRGAKSFIGSTGDTLNDLESKIPIDPQAPAVVSNTRAALANANQQFSSNPNLAAAFRDPRISKFLDALTPQTRQEATGVLDANGTPITRTVNDGGGLSWQDLRDFRSRVGEIIGQPGLASDGAQIGQLRQLYGALSDDIQQTAAEEGPQALNAWTRWNNYARARANRIDNVVSLILGSDGDKAPQSAFEAMQRLANAKGGDPIKLGQALRSMPEDEANSVRATVIDGLGHATPGNQDATGDVFSPAQWVTNWNKIGDRAKSVLFTGEHRQALDDLATLFSGMKSSSKFANTSKTGISVVAAANTATAIAHPVIGALSFALQYPGGKLLASPAFAKRVAATPLNVKAAEAFWSRPWVQTMVAKNPAIGAEINAFQQAFLSHVNDNTASSAAAQPEEHDQNQTGVPGNPQSP